MIPVTPEDKELLNDFFTSDEFREMAEKDIGPLVRTVFEPEDNEIRVYGERGAKSLVLDSTLATLKGQMQ